MQICFTLTLSQRNYVAKIIDYIRRTYNSIKIAPPDHTYKRKMTLRGRDLNAVDCTICVFDCAQASEG